jgi:hypothetical protein
MTREIVKIKMPFKNGFIFREREVPFLFKIMTLEIVADEMGMEFGEIFSSAGNAEIHVYTELLWAGYIAACKESYEKPKFSREQGIFWAEFMPASARQIVLREIEELMGKMKAGNEKAAESLKKKLSP